MGLQWVRLDTQWPHNPKFLMLVEDKKWRAISVYMAGIAWAGGQGQAGFIPHYALSMIHGTRREADELVDVALWHKREGGWDINDWEEYQLSTEEQKKRTDKARNAALFRWHGKNATTPRASDTQN